MSYTQTFYFVVSKKLVLYYNNTIMNILYNKRLEKNEYKEYNKKLPKFWLILKNILKISVPAAMETLLIGIIGLIDTMMVGGVGVEALAGVSICQQPVFVTLAISFGINIGITTIIARRKGENNNVDACKTLKQTLYLVTFVGLLFTILSIFLAKPFLSLAGADSDTMPYAIQYFQTVSSVLVFNYLRLAICAGLRAEGKTRLTLIINLLANGINLLLNYCLIHGHFGFPALGVAGAGIATAISNFIAFLVCFIIIYFRKGFLNLRTKTTENKDEIFTKETIGTIIKFSSPAFIEQLFMRIGFFLIAMIVNRLGKEVVAMNAIISGVISLAFNVTDGFATGASSLVGKSMGEKNFSLAYAYARISQICSFILGLFMITFILIFRQFVCKLFSDDITVIEGAKKTLRLAVFVTLPQSLQWVTTGALRGAGDIKYTARTSMISVTIIRPLFSYLLCYPLGLGLLGSWCGMFIDQTIRFVFNNHRLVNLKWLKIKV